MFDLKLDPARPPTGGIAARRSVGALAGLVAAGAGLAAAEVVGAATRPEATPLLVVGDAVVDLTPPPLKDLAVTLLGTADKPVLLGGIAAVLAVAAALIGIAARRRDTVGAFGIAGIALFASAGAAAAVTRPDGGPFDVLPSVLGGAVTYVVLRLLSASAPPAAPGRRPPVSGAVDLPGDGDPAGSAGSAEPADRHPGSPAAGADVDPVALPSPRHPEEPSSGFDRRRFVLLAGATAAASAAAGGGARWYASARADAVAADRAIRLPRPAVPAPALPDGAELDIDGLSSFFTPNDSFYRIDTALSVPRLDATTWSLRVHGRGAREREYSFDDLLGRPDLMERDVTLACVSNPVGGSYVGNARWIGVPVAALLREAGVRSPADGGSADQLVSRSSDGMTIGTPVADVLDGRDAMLAVGMNGRPLPVEHGFPVRMVVPGLYGYVSACKWLVELELTSFADFDAYWVPRGWSARGPIKTQSRIDTPRDGDRIASGRVAVAGVAWAQHVGVDAVEVRIDNGPWQQARLAEEDSSDTWRQWVLEWDAEPGDHRIGVRATDREGRPQTGTQAPVAPDGATGHHVVELSVN
ncbi:molybdopterin-dependent oxidoreductase [Nocardiopsis mangrovi]|uniref:Molybdopterin-dependent oxidoreductase n=1 Tax=Nocardiopsis mangrovi TaxID=1179818 RepID=A0ABV9DUI1_9ACTN